MVVAGVSAAVMASLATAMAVTAPTSAATSSTSGSSVRSRDSSSSSGTDERWDVPSWDDDAGYDAVPYGESSASGSSLPSAHTSSGGS